MRSLVTGATGFLGSALVRRLAEAHGPDRVTGLVRDPLPPAEEGTARALRDLGVALLPSDLLALPVPGLEAVEFDVLYHLAAETDSAASALALRINTEGTGNLLQTLGRDALAGKRVVLAGATAAVDRASRPRSLMKETDPKAPRTEYGRSKLGAERVLESFAREFGFRYAIPRFSPVWTPDLRTGFLGAFLEMAKERSFLRRVAWPGRITMVRRKDAAEILRHLGETDAAVDAAVHVGDGKVYRYRDLQRDIRALTGDRGWFLPIPGFLWGLVRAVAWLPVVRDRVPWRLSCLIGDDLAVDTGLLEGLYPGSLTDWEGSKAELQEALRGR